MTISSARFYCVTILRQNGRVVFEHRRLIEPISNYKLATHSLATIPLERSCHAKNLATDQLEMALRVDTIRRMAHGTKALLATITTALSWH